MKRWIARTLSCMLVVAAVNATAETNDKEKALDKANYTAYQGQPQSWPMGDQPAKTLETKSGVPIYRTLPDRPYEILGAIQVKHTGSVDNRVSQAAEAAGADAILACANDAFVKAGIAV